LSPTSRDDAQSLQSVCLENVNLPASPDNFMTKNLQACCLARAYSGQFHGPAAVTSKVQEGNMSSKQCIAVVVVLTALGQPSALAGQTPKITGRTPGRLSWSELSPLVVDRKVQTTLPDGTRIQGQALAVRPDALVMDITKTSNRKAHPKGQAEIPRASVTELAVIRDKGPGKLIGGILGTVGGAFAAGAATYYGGGGGAAAGWLLILPVSAVGGYYAGKAVDRRVTRIVIAPDQPATSTAEEALQ
jgi:hypothetical protein